MRTMTIKDNGLSHLLARFKWSLVTELTVPDLTTRTAILNRKLERLDAQCPQEVVEYVALRVISNIRELEDAMMMILEDASANHREIDVDMAKKLIDKYVKCSAEFYGRCKSDTH